MDESCTLIRALRTLSVIYFGLATPMRQIVYVVA